MDRLVDGEDSDVESLNSIKNLTHKKHVSFELDTDQEVGIT